MVEPTSGKRASASSLAELVLAELGSVHSTLRDLAGSVGRLDEHVGSLDREFHEMNGSVRDLQAWRGDVLRHEATAQGAQQQREADRARVARAWKVAESRVAWLVGGAVVGLAASGGGLLVGFVW